MSNVLQFFENIQRVLSEIDRNGSNSLSWKVQSNGNDPIHCGDSVDAIIQSNIYIVNFL